MRRPRSAEDILDAAEERARARLVRRVEDLGEEVGRALPGAGTIRRHPFVFTAAAALIGAVAAPVLVRALGVPLKALRSTGSILALLDLRAIFARRT